MNTKREAGHCYTSSGYRVFACEQCEQRDNRMDTGFACSHPVLTRACNENKSQKINRNCTLTGVLREAQAVAGYACVNGSGAPCCTVW